MKYQIQFFTRVSFITHLTGITHIYGDICRNRFMESIQDPVLQFTYMASRENMSKIYKLCLREYSIKVKTDVP